MMTNAYLKDPLLEPGQLEKKRKERGHRKRTPGGAAKVLLTIIILLKMGISSSVVLERQRERKGERSRHGKQTRVRAPTEERPFYCSLHDTESTRPQ